MDHVKFLIPITLLLLFYRPVPVNAEIIDISQHSGIIRDSAGNYKTINGRGSITSINTGTQLQIRNPSLPVPTTKGNQFVDVSRTALVDITKVGGALASLAKKLTPLGMAAGTVAYICAETNICEQAGEWFFQGDIAQVGTEQKTDLTGTFTSGVSPFPVYPNLYGAAGHMCDNTAGGISIHHINRLSDTGSTQRYHVFCDLNGSPVSSGIVTAPSSTVSSESRPVNEDDWNDAESSLNDAASTDHILENGGEVPVDVSTPPALDAPINQPIGSETITTKDAQGNTTGTQVTETSIDITDAATTENPNQIDVKEKKTVTTYDLNNNPTGSTTTESEIRPPAPPDPPDIDYEIDFDDVNDKDLEEYEFPDIFSYESWGEGSCPADRSVSYGYGNLNLSMQPACDFATGVRPIILVIAGLSAMFIISGIKTE